MSLHLLAWPEPGDSVVVTKKKKKQKKTHITLPADRITALKASGAEINIDLKTKFGGLMMSFI